MIIDVAAESPDDMELTRIMNAIYSEIIIASMALIINVIE